MVGTKGSGRKAGFTHSEETRRKIAEAARGRTKTRAEKEKISRSKALYDLDGKCAQRYEELRSDYPDVVDFFEENESEILFAMQDIRSEKELDDILKFHETSTLRPETPYQYSSSSCYAAEDAMIQLLDFKRYLRKFH
jgi:FKBP-type peptidyl-prolyl cis-trans isomerase (trigger factor)